MRAGFRLAALSALLLSVAPASAKLTAAGDDDVRFLATGPAGMKIHGTAPSLGASEESGKLVIEVPLGNLKTGIGLRDRHLRGYLETKKYPKATLGVERSKLSFPANDKTVEGKATGDFTLHGVTKPLTFAYKALRTGSDYHVQALASVDIRDHDVTVPCYLGVCVDPVVKLKVRFKLRDQ